MTAETGETTLRLFVALELPDAARRAISAWAMSELPRAEGLRLLADEALHVTLCFLGATPASERDGIGAACREAAAGRGPLRLSLGEPLALPRRRPRVVAVGVAAAGDTGDTGDTGATGATGEREHGRHPREREHRRDPGEREHRRGSGEREHGRHPGEIGSELDQLQAALSARLATGGWYRPELRPFLAHLTVARARSHARIDARALARVAPIETPTFVADTVTVFRSHTRPGGARYEPLVRVLLAPGA